MTTRDEKGRFLKGNHAGKEFTKGSIPWNKDKKTGLVPKTAFGSEDASFVQKSGKDNSNYIHGQRCDDAKFPYSPEFMKMRGIIIQRDEVCKMCGKKNADTVHHINLDKNYNSETNLILLCRSCHSTIHGKHIEKKMIPMIMELIQ